MLPQSRFLLCYCLLLLASRTPGASTSGECQLPDTWTGSWFESGVREGVNISTASLSHKGTCVKRVRHSSQYIFKDRRDGCHRCLSIHEKHHNILQYKESRCVAERPHKDICHSISVDEPLRTLFRVEAVPEPCPLTAPHTFSYSRGHGLCDYPLSSMSDCGEGSGLMFRYQACPDIKGSESGVERAECIARWKEGSTYYFVARMSSNRISPGDYEQIFRCFVYQKQYGGFLLSQSGEAKCNLYTAQEGHTTLNLRKLTAEDTECQFPEWLRRHRKYLSLARDTVLHFNHKGTAFSITAPDSSLSARTGEVEVEEEEGKELVCARLDQLGTNFSRIVTVSTHNCESGFQCVEVESYTEDVLSLRVGRLSPNMEEACHPQLFFYNISPLIVTSVHPHTLSCPFSGQYRRSAAPPVAPLQDSNPPPSIPALAPPPPPLVPLSPPLLLLPLTPLAPSSPQAAAPLTPLPSPPSPSSACPWLVSSCSNSHTMSFIQDCGKSIQELTCEASWDSPEGRMVLVSESKPSAKRFCLAVRRAKENLTVELRLECGTRPEAQTTSLDLHYQGDCSPTALATANGGPRAAVLPPPLNLPTAGLLLFTFFIDYTLSC